MAWRYALALGGLAAVPRTISTPTAPRVPLLQDRWEAALERSLERDRRWLASEDLRSSALRREPVRVIVRFDVPRAAEARIGEDERKLQRSRLAAPAKELLERVSQAKLGRVTEFASLPCVSLTLQRGAWEELVSLVGPEGARVRGEGGVPVGFRVTVVTELQPQSAAPARESVTIDDLRTELAVAGLGLDGTGQTVVVIDDGVSDGAGIPLLQGRVLEGQWVRQGGVDASSTPSTGRPRPRAPGYLSHGTQVACMVAAIAPGATIYPMRVDEGGPGIPTDNVVKALQLVHEELIGAGTKVAAVCVALGDDGVSGAHLLSCASSSDEAQCLLDAIDDLIADRVAVVFPAGNEGSADGVSYPGCLDSGFTVGGTHPRPVNAAGCRLRAGFSNWGALIDVTAPAMGIQFAVDWSPYPFTVSQGTSVSTPLVAGAIAILRQALPTVPIEDLQDAIVGSVTVAHATEAGCASALQDDPPRAYLDVADALARLSSSPEPPAPPGTPGEER